MLPKLIMKISINFQLPLCFRVRRFLIYVLMITLWTCCLPIALANHHHHNHHHHLSHDYRIIHHDELRRDLNEFHSEGVQTFSQLLIDLPRYQIIVGARDHLFRLSLDGLHKLQESHWSTKNTTTHICLMKGQPEKDCHNFIMVLLAHNNSIFTCGTNAFNPICSWRQMDNLDSDLNKMSGVGMCPYSPQQNITAIFTSQGDYYIGTMVDFSARDPAIYRMMGNSPMLRTTQYNSKWLSDPNFVGSFEIDQYIYFFFRETAMEFINCGKIVYSRVARLCKNDKGGQYMLKDNWTTFLKARLNCSVPGEYPFYYNEIQSVFYLEHDQTMYATFTTPTNSIHGSAICTFNMAAINRAFEGAFKYQSNPSSAWERVSSYHRQYECESQGGSTRHLASDKYQLMDEAVQSAHNEPIFTQELERFRYIVVDVVATKVHDRMHVLYVTTVEGLVKKLMILPRTQKTCLVEILHVFPKNHSQTILRMKLLKEKLNSLYIGTEMSVLKIPLSRCGRFHTRRTCLDAMDPYCGWDTVKDRCTTPPNDDPLDNTWDQSVLSCPVLTNPVNGGWGTWSKWSPCPHHGPNNALDLCLCRSRQCDNPKPAYGGNDCEGQNYEVTNCTRNGQWTEWSSWSACSQSCGMAVRTRKRTCGNPEPLFGGKPCNGSDRSEIYCASNPPCPTLLLPPVDGQWSEWSAWDECSAPCNRGMQSRRRRCNSPAPQNGGRDCIGCNVEYQDCNRHSCQEERRSSNWTPWLIHNLTKDGNYQQRFRFVCRAQVPDSRMIRVGLVKTEERFCMADGANCIDKAYIGNDGDWSEWSTWSPCSSSCGGGVQHRKRACDNPRPSGGGSNCMGENREEESCNLQPCAADWSVWSMWSRCSPGNRLSISRRTRLCHTSTILQGMECVGSDIEHKRCDQDTEDVMSWTSWSDCDDNNYQHRHTICPPEDSSPCPGIKEDSRPCDYSDNIPKVVTAGTTGMGAENLIVGCLVCFTIGSALGAVAMHVYNAKRTSGWRGRRELTRTNSKKVANNTYQPSPMKNNQYSTGSLRKKNQNSNDYGQKRTLRPSSFNVVSEQDKYG